MVVFFLGVIIFYFKVELYWGYVLFILLDCKIFDLRVRFIFDLFLVMFIDFVIDV